MGFFQPSTASTDWVLADTQTEQLSISYTATGTEIVDSILIFSGSLPPGCTQVSSISGKVATLIISSGSTISSDVYGSFPLTIRAAARTTPTSPLSYNFFNHTINVLQPLSISVSSKTFTYTGSPISLPYIVFPNIPVTVTYTPSGGGGTASSNPPTLPGVYNVSIEAIYGKGYIGSAESTLIIEKPIGKITFPAIPNKNYESPDFTLSASSTSGTPVSFISENPNAISISGNRATILDAGASFVNIRAVENNPYYNTNSVTNRVEFARAPQTITAVTPQNVTTRTIPFQISAKSTSQLDLSYSITQGPATITSGGVITILGAGRIRVAISQPGNSNYEPTSTSITFFATQYVQVFQEGVTGYFTTANQRSSCPTPVAQDFLLCEPQPGVWPSIQSELAGVWERVELWWEYVKKTENW